MGLYYDGRLMPVQVVRTRRQAVGVAASAAPSRQTHTRQANDMRA
jgi:hypothetical protein